MDIFDATLKIKDYIYNGNNSLLKLNDEIELSRSGISFMFSQNMIKNVKDYHKKSTLHNNKVCGCHKLDGEIMINYRSINQNLLKPKYFKANLPEKVNTKEYWTFLNAEFKFCDVMSYPIFPNLENYFGVKGPLYDNIINKCGGLKIFENKKILEIGPGYGYLPKILKENQIKHQYYCADIVQRFDHINFIDLDGYNLSPFITEKFDIIIMFDVFQHLSLDIIENYFEEFNKLLNDDGEIIISTPILPQGSVDNFIYAMFFAQTYEIPSEEKFLDILDENNYIYEKMDNLVLNKYTSTYFNDGNIYKIRKNNEKNMCIFASVK